MTDHVWVQYEHVERTSSSSRIASSHHQYLSLAYVPCVHVAESSVTAIERHACKKGGGKDILGHSRTFLTTSVCEDGGLARSCAVDHDRFRVRVHGDEALLAHVLLSRGQIASGFLQ